MKKYLFIAFTFCLFALVGQSQEATALLDRNEIKLGEQTRIDLELRCSAAASNIMLPALKDTITKFVEIVEISNVDTTFDEDDITTKIFTQRITITAWDSGYHAIPPFSFVVDGDTIKTEPLLLTVNSVTLTADQDIKDIKDIIEVPFSFVDWLLENRWLLLSIILGIVILIVGIVLFRKYANRPQEEKIEIVPKEAADVVALRKLDELNTKKHWQNNKVKVYYSELSFIIREYIENRFGINALESTTDEIINMLSIRNTLDSSMQQKLHQVLMLSDMAKFAKQEPVASENEEALKHSYTLVKTTAFKEEKVNSEAEDATPSATLKENENA